EVVYLITVDGATDTERGLTSRRSGNAISEDYTEDFLEVTRSSSRHELAETFVEGDVRLRRDTTTTVTPDTVSSDGEGNTVSGRYHAFTVSAGARVATVSDTTRYLDDGSEVVLAITGAGTDTERVLDSDRRGNSISGEYTRDVLVVARS